MLYVMIKVDFSYADEYDIAGLKVLTAQEYDVFIKAAQNFYSGTFWFGTNEETEIDNQEELMSCFTSRVLEQEEYDLLKRLGIDNFGHASSFINFVINSQEEEEKE